MTTKKLVAILAAITFTGTSLSACSSSPSTDSGGEQETGNFMDFSETQEEYLATLEMLNFPPDTPKPTSLEAEDKTAISERGMGDTLASNVWECAWEKEWVNTYATDPERAEAALKELEKAPGMPYMQEPRADHTVREWFAEMMEKARLGDPSQMQIAAGMCG